MRADHGPTSTASASPSNLRRRQAKGLASQKSEPSLHRADFTEHRSDHSRVRPRSPKAGAKGLFEAPFALQYGKRRYFNRIARINAPSLVDFTVRPEMPERARSLPGCRNGTAGCLVAQRRHECFPVASDSASVCRPVPHDHAQPSRLRPDIAPGCRREQA